MTIDGRAISAFVFDMDGTLLDSMSHWRAENRRFLARRGLPVPEDIKDEIDTMSSHAFARRFASEHGGYTYADICREYEAHMAELYLTDISPKPGARAFLRALAARGVKMCVATATPRDVAQKALERHGLRESLSFVTDDKGAAVTKAHSRYYTALAERLETPVENCVMFEDSAYAMRAAKGAGMLVLGMEERMHLGYPDLMREIRETSLFLAKDFYDAAARLSLQL